MTRLGNPSTLQFADSPRVVARCDWYIYGRGKNAFVGFQRRILTGKMVSILHTVIQQTLLTTRRRASAKSLKHHIVRHSASYWVSEWSVLAFDTYYRM